MKIKSYSKVNLSLRILKKLKNGMHSIETNSILVNLYDEIILKKSRKNVTIFKGEFKNKVNKKNNTVINTLKLLTELNIIKKSYKVIIKKNIPVFAGLGGGTSNSVSIFKYFMKNKINDKNISIFEKVIGSDFRLFLNKSSFQKKIAKVNKSPNRIYLPFLIIYPNINCKTKNIYNLSNSLSSPSGNFYNRKQNREKFIEKIKKDKNDLQNIVVKKYPKILKLIHSISIQKGCIISRMTGSGSACFGVFKSKKTVKLAFTKLKRKYPKYWCAITKTI